MDDLIERLHALSRYEHSDYSIGDEAATEIEALRAEVEQMTNMARMQAARADATERGARHHKTRAERLAEALREAEKDLRQLGPLPEQAGWCVLMHGHAAAFASNAERAAGLSCGATTPLFTADQMRAYAAQEVAAERELCAKACEEVDLHSGDHLKNSDPRVTCAAAIRAR